MTLEELLDAPSVPAEISLTDAEIVRLVRKHKGLLKQRERDQAFWAATNENLKKAYEKLDEKDRELARAYGIIQEDLSVASRIQQALLPKAPPEMAEELEIAVFHRQLAEVGGDYYDFFTTRSGRYAIGVFDISGHGVSAALVMTYLKAQFMTIMERMDSPKEIVGWINGVSYEFLKTIKKYATVNFIIFRRERLQYVSGGGFGLVVRGKENETFAKRDPFLGLRNRPFHQYELPFGPGDLLALYTDGIVEAQNAGGEDYTVRRLNDLIASNAGRSPQQIVDLCVEDYTAFREKDSDDITLILARRKGKG